MVEKPGVIRHEEAPASVVEGRVAVVAIGNPITTQCFWSFW
jgi:hypothetical protein